MTTANTPTNDELLDIGNRLYQELMTYIKAGEESGCDMTFARQLPKEWEALWLRTDRYWQTEILDIDVPNADALDAL